LGGEEFQAETLLGVLPRMDRMDEMEHPSLTIQAEEVTYCRFSCSAVARFETGMSKLTSCLRESSTDAAGSAAVGRLVVVMLILRIFTK